MMRIIENQPDDVLGIMASETLTKEDYEEVLIPATEDKLQTHGKIKMLFVLEHLKSFNLAAMWEDTKYGIEHWKQFEKIALVTNEDWVSKSTKLFIPFFPGEVKVYNIDEIDKAEAWIKA